MRGSEDDACDLCRSHLLIANELHASKDAMKVRDLGSSMGIPFSTTAGVETAINVRTEFDFEQHPKDLICTEPKPVKAMSSQSEEVSLPATDKRKDSGPNLEASSNEYSDRSNLVERIHELESSLKLADTGHEELFIIHQKQIFKNLEPGLWEPRDDDNIKADFNKLARRMKWWSKSFVIKTTRLEDSLDRRDYRILLDALQHVVDLMAEDLPGTLPRKLGEGKGLAVLLNALLARTIYTEVFQNPFFCVGATGGELLNSMYDKFISCKCLDGCLDIS